MNGILRYIPGELDEDYKPPKKKRREKRKEKQKKRFIR